MVSTKQDRRRQGLALALLCMAQFMVVLDFSIVNIALPSMQKDLGLSTQNLQWIISAYSLTFGGFLLLGGRMADLYGRRLIFMIGLCLFTLASLAGGLAQAGIWLIVSRAAQGLGAALVAPTALSLITTTFAEGAPRNKAFGAVGAIASLGFAAGAILGGLLTAGPGWRWVMFVNVPIGVAAFVLAPLLLTESRAQSEERRVDVLGAILVTTGLIALVYALAQGNEWGWGALATLGLLAVAAILLVAFVLVETHVKAPLVRLSIFRQRTITGANLISFLAPGAFGSLIFILTLYMQKVLNYSAVETGLAFLPLALVILVISNVSSRLVTRIGMKMLLVSGLSFVVVGLLLLAPLPANGNFVSALLPGIMVVGLGMGSTFATMVIAATAGVSNDEQGLASGLFNTTQQVGSGLALATISAVSGARAASLLQGGSATKEALTGGFQLAILACVGFTVLALLMAIFVIREKEGPSSANRVVAASDNQVGRSLVFQAAGTGEEQMGQGDKSID